MHKCSSLAQLVSHAQILKVIAPLMLLEMWSPIHKPASVIYITTTLLTVAASYARSTVNASMTQLPLEPINKNAYLMFSSKNTIYVSLVML